MSNLEIALQLASREKAEQGKLTESELLGAAWSQIAQLQQELKVARSEAIQAQAQAAFVTAERDQLREDARQLAQALKSAMNSVEEWGNYAPQWAKDKWELEADRAALDALFEQYGAKYLEPTSCDT